MASHYIPQSEAVKNEIYSFLGIESIEELFRSIPDSIRKNTCETLEAPLDEQSLFQRFEEVLETNIDTTAFLGFGMYEHYAPVVVNQLASLRNFVTGYTPYQPELAQGSLQVLFEFQSMICELTQMDVANASLYDGATAMVESVRLSLRNISHTPQKRLKHVVFSIGIYPHYLDVAKTYFSPESCANLNIQIHFTEITDDGVSDIDNVSIKPEEVDVYVVQNPNLFGILETSSLKTKFPNVQILYGTAELMSSTVLDVNKYDIDIFWGEGQSLGLPVAFGGPSLGFLAVKKEYMRQIPGRLVGKTKAKNSFDKEVDAYVITLATREQHIRRERATSNICSNQTLMAIRSAIYMASQGIQGMTDTMIKCLENAQTFVQFIQEHPMLELTFKNTNYFQEIAWQTKSSTISTESLFETAVQKDIILGRLTTLFFSERPGSIVSYFSDVMKQSDYQKMIQFLNDTLRKK